MSAFRFREGREYSAHVTPAAAQHRHLPTLLLERWLVISLLVKRVRSVTPYALGLGFGAYVLSAFSGIFGDVKLRTNHAFQAYQSGLHRPARRV